MTVSACSACSRYPSLVDLGIDGSHIWCQNQAASAQQHSQILHTHNAPKAWNATHLLSADISPRAWLVCFVLDLPVADVQHFACVNPTSEMQAHVVAASKLCYVASASRLTNCLRSQCTAAEGRTTCWGLLTANMQGNVLQHVSALLLQFQPDSPSVTLLGSHF